MGIEFFIEWYEIYEYILIYHTFQKEKKKNMFNGVW